MQYRPLKITYSFFHCQSNIINNDNGLPLSWICFSFLQPNILHIPSTPFWSITHSEQTICYSMTQIPQIQISQSRQARSKKKYIFKLWDKPLSHSDSKLCIHFWFILNQIPYEQSVIKLYWFFPLSCNLFLLFFPSLQPLFLIKTSISCFISLLHCPLSLIYIYIFIRDNFLSPLVQLFFLSKSSVTPILLNLQMG